MIIPLPPNSLIFSTASKSLNLSSPAVPLCLQHWNHNYLASSLPVATKAAPTQIQHNHHFCFMGAIAPKYGFILLKNSLANREHMVIP